MPSTCHAMSRICHIMACHFMSFYIMSCHMHVIRMFFFNATQRTLFTIQYLHYLHAKKTVICMSGHLMWCQVHIISFKSFRVVSIMSSHLRWCHVHVRSCHVKYMSINFMLRWLTVSRIFLHLSLMNPYYHSFSVNVIIMVSNKMPNHWWINYGCHGNLLCQKIILTCSPMFEHFFHTIT